MLRRLIKSHIILLLIVGLFSQDNGTSDIRFDPETGEIINPDSTIKDTYLIDRNEIWQNEIPPSHYLKTFAISNENSYTKGLRFWSYASLLGGITLYKTSKTAEGSATGIILGLAGAIGITSVVNDKPKTPAYKQFMKMENLQNNSNKEKFAYEVLVSLAKESRKSKKSIRNSHGDINSFENLAAALVASAILKQLEDKTPNLFLTREEKVLKNYLNQIPIDNVIDW